MCETTPTTGVLSILGAAFGLGVVTNTVNGLIDRSANPQTLTFVANDATFGDTWSGTPKSCTVIFHYEGGAVYIICGKENQTFDIYPGSTEAIALENYDRAPVADDSPLTLTVIGASYGPDDQTPAVRNLINASTQTLSFAVNDATFGDTWQGMQKSFTIVAAYPNQVPFTDVVAEYSNYALSYRPVVQILSAYWAMQDVSATVRNAISRRALSIAANDTNFGDPFQGQRKSLVVVYQYANNAPQLATALEYETLSFSYSGPAPYNPPSNPATLNVLFATYGPADVTAIVNGLIVNNALSLTPSNGLMGGDPNQGSTKTFNVIYTYGASEVFTATGQEYVPFSLAAPTPVARGYLASLQGLFAAGDVLKLQTAAGGFVNVTNNTLTTTLFPAQAVSFTIGVSSTDASQLILKTPDEANVIVQTDGTLGTGFSTAAFFVPAIAPDGTIALSIPSSTGAPSFVSTSAGNTLLAHGSFVTDFTTAFYIQSAFTAAGYESHLTLLRPLDTLDIPSPLLLKVIWDLTGGFCLAVGLGPLLIRQQVGPGFYGLLFGNQTIKETILAAVAFAVQNPGKTSAIAGAFTAVLTTIWQQGLLWTMLRSLLVSGAWIVGLAAVTALLRVIFPVVGAAEILVSFVAWAYSTVNDCIAYSNSIPASSNFAPYSSEAALPYATYPVIDMKLTQA